MTARQYSQSLMNIQFMMNMIQKIQAGERADWKHHDEERCKRELKKELHDEEQWLTLFLNNFSLEKKEAVSLKKAEMAQLQARAH